MLERLSSLDRAFFDIEEGPLHMHVGAVAIFEGGGLVRPDGGVDGDALRHYLAASLDGVPRFRQRVHFVPMLGTVYRSPSPGEPPFVSEGSQVTADQTLCLIECMKLFNTIPVGVTGRLVRFAVENATLVEFDQPIAYIQPD